MSSHHGFMDALAVSECILRYRATPQIFVSLIMTTYRQ